MVIAAINHHDVHGAFCNARTTASPPKPAPTITTLGFFIMLPSLAFYGYGLSFSNIVNDNCMCLIGD